VLYLNGHWASERQNVSTARFLTAAQHAPFVPASSGLQRGIMVGQRRGRETGTWQVSAKQTMDSARPSPPRAPHLPLCEPATTPDGCVLNSAGHAALPRAPPRRGLRCVAADPQTHSGESIPWLPRCAVACLNLLRSPGSGPRQAAQSATIHVSCSALPRFLESVTANASRIHQCVCLSGKDRAAS
jgi:hypothetical protein